MKKKQAEDASLSEDASSMYSNGIFSGLMMTNLAVQQSSNTWPPQYTGYYTCFRYWWDDIIRSRKASLSKRSRSFKAYQTPKHCTASYDTKRTMFTTLEWKKQSFSSPSWRLRQHPHCASVVVSFKLVGELRFFMQCRCLSEHDLREHKN